ncbi:MAG TPA: 23S rRNA (adenine(2503)-C(2))-methyltransferase RlmN, partial [bacterium]|nr:23S rRNA (adenine(2503)-C(2))-methyltransferase RlmN [bacterium]
MKESILELDKDALRTWCESKKQPAFRSLQIYDWLYRKNVSEFQQMTNIPEVFRGLLSKAFTGLCTETAGRAADADGTVKYLLRLGDGHAVESVFLPRGGDHTLCISSQVGCALGCRFCATGAL